MVEGEVNELQDRLDALLRRRKQLREAALEVEQALEQDQLAKDGQSLQENEASKTDLLLALHRTQEQYQVERQRRLELGTFLCGWICVILFSFADGVPDTAFQKQYLSYVNTGLESS